MKRTADEGRVEQHFINTLYDMIITSAVRNSAEKLANNETRVVVEHEIECAWERFNHDTKLTSDSLIRNALNSIKRIKAEADDCWISFWHLDRFERRVFDYATRHKLNIGSRTRIESTAVFIRRE